LQAIQPAKNRASYEIVGEIQPPGRAYLSLHNAVTPFSTTGQSDAGGHFRFRHLARGAYSLAVLLPGRGEARQTIDVGPGRADAKRRVSVKLNMDDPALVSMEALESRALVSAKELSIPWKAQREYAEARKKLEQDDATAAVEHIRRAVAIAPQYWAAWNALGTIAYKTRDFAQAENCFREALKQNRKAFEPLVNLGGVLLTIGKWKEALPYNEAAVASRPHDALANSQVGMNYFFMADLDRATQYLSAAKRIDPGHFSHPQLILADINSTRHDPAAAIRELEDFLRVHPDWSGSREIARKIERLRRQSAISWSRP
jgi:tetratricopeptide (TPR) repeat protein